jgi:hypothetical protein
MRRSAFPLLIATCLLVPFLAVPLHGQPFGKPATYLSTGPGDGYVEVPSHSAFNVGNQLTIEFWAADQRRENGCVIFVSKGLAHYWVGHCRDGKLRSYAGGFGTDCEAGTLPRDGFPHHFAVTQGAGVRRHYIDGELVGVCERPGSIPANGHPLRFFFNPLADAHTPIAGMLFEVRFWNVARTQAQIRQTMLREIDEPMPGLVAAWHLRGNAFDAVGGHHGSVPQAGAGFAYLNPTALCGGDVNTACLLGRVNVFTTFQKLSLPAANGQRELVSTGWGRIVPGASTDSVLFWFFAADNWEVLVKTVDACAFNDRLWVFSAATTDQHFTLWAIDNPTGSVKAYVNFAGAPAPAVTDTSAFATCP